MKSAIVVLILALISISCTPERRTTDSPAIVKTAGISELSPAQARTGTDAAYSQFIDVRTPEEYAEGHAYRARNIPLDTLAANLTQIEKNEPVYLICRTDNRSREAAKVLADAGYKQAIVIRGGTEAWKAAGMPMAN